MENIVVKNHKFKKNLGQNFIVDEFLLDDIVDESNIDENDIVIEIGPGNGALTRSIANKAKMVYTVELDKSLIPLLKSNLKDYDNVEIINADFLSVDIKDFIKDDIKQSFKVVANIPYYITSPIIMKLLMSPYIKEMTIMVQKEVAERIVARKGGKEYGVLTLACNFFSNTECLFIVGKENFYPMPKVDSAVVRFIKHKEFLDLNNEINFHIEDDTKYKKLFSLIKASFSQRRKKLINSLVNVGKYDKEKIKNVFNKLGFNENIRAEELSLDEYKKLLEELC